MTERPHIEPPPDLDPALARFIEELARAAVRRDLRMTLNAADGDLTANPTRYNAPSKKRHGAGMTGDLKRSPENQADADKYLRNSATREQAKQRRLNADGPVGRRQPTIEQLPLFADERSLSDAVLGRGKYTHWRAVVQLLEGRGFPKIDGLMGGRYWPAVKAFFDREYRIDANYHVAARDGPEALGTYKRKRVMKK